MSLTLYRDNDNDISVPRLAWADGQEIISDADLIVTLGSQADGYCGAITNVTGTTTAHVVSTVDTGKLSNGDQVVICQVVGTKEINGVATVANVSGTGFDLSGVAKTNPYISGGKWFKCIPGVIEAECDYKGNGKYLVVADEDVNLEVGTKYKTIVQARNYGYHVEEETYIRDRGS